MACSPCAARAAARKAAKEASTIGKPAQKFSVKLPGGLEVSKSSEAAAISFSARHPGSKVIAKAA
jgi:hypothetical protein